MDVPVLMGPVQNQEEMVNPQLGGNVEQQEVRRPSNLVWGGDENGSEDQSGEQVEQLGEDVDKNPMKELNSRASLTAEGETGAALDVEIVEPKDDRAMITEENTKVVTIESSPKWGGTLIEEEHPEEQENVETKDIPSTSAANLETPTPRRKRRRSKDEIKASPPIRIKITRSVTSTEAAQERWATLEA